MKIPMTYALLLLLSACAAGPDQKDPPPAPQTAAAADAEKAIGAAEAAQKRAGAARVEWRDTGALISQAREAARQGAFDTAVSKAAAAERQSELALRQKEREMGAAQGK